MDGELISENVSSEGCFDRVEISNHIGNGNVGCCELLYVTVLAFYPLDRCVIAVLFEYCPTILRDRCIRIITDFAACEDRYFVVEEQGNLT